MISYIDDHKARFGVEPICETLQFAPSTYYAAKQRPPSTRSIRDEELKPKIKRVHKDNFSVYGARKVWCQLHREGTTVARCTVERLMADLGLEGRRRGRKHRTRRRHPTRRIRNQLAKSQHRRCHQPPNQ